MDREISERLCRLEEKIDKIYYNTFPDERPVPAAEAADQITRKERREENADIWRRYRELFAKRK